MTGRNDKKGAVTGDVVGRVVGRVVGTVDQCKHSLVSYTTLPQAKHIASMQLTNEFKKQLFWLQINGAFR